MKFHIKEVTILLSESYPNCFIYLLLFYLFNSYFIYYYLWIIGSYKEGSTVL